MRSPRRRTVRLQGEGADEDPAVAPRGELEVEHEFDVAWRDHPRTGYVGLQDHGADCWFRNIKLRALPAAADGAAPGGEGGQR